MIGHPVFKSIRLLIPLLFLGGGAANNALLCAANLSLPDSNPPALTRFELETYPSNSISPALKLKLFQTAPATQAEPRTDILSAYIHVRAAGFVSWDDSAGILVGSQLDRYPQLYQVAAPKRERRQRTFFSKRISGFYPNPVPQKKLMLFTQDAEGDEDFRLSQFDLTSNQSQSLDLPLGRVEGILWNDSGTAFAYAHTPKGTDRWDIRLYTFAKHIEMAADRNAENTNPDSLILSLPGTWTPMDFSPDGKFLLLQKYISANSAELFILNLEQKTIVPLLSEKTNFSSVFLDQGIFIPSKNSGKIPWSVAFTSNHEGEFIRLYLADANGDKPPIALTPKISWDIEWAKANPKRNLLIYAVNENGRSQLYALNLKSLLATPLREFLTKPTRIVGLPDGVISGIQFDTRDLAQQSHFAFTVTSPTFRGDVFTYRLGQKKPIRWTFSEAEGLSKKALQNPQLVHCPTFDSIPGGASGLVPRKIPAWVYLPKAKKTQAAKARSKPTPGPDTRPSPVLILIHGGPEAQARPTFDPFIQYAVNTLGLAIIQPNVRGSSGYGKSWLKADDGYLRMDAVHDIGAILDWIKTQPRLDSTRIAVAGRSYGGFMALSAWLEYGPQARNSIEIRAAISTVGISHFPTFLQNTSGYRRDLRRVEYGDERDPKMAKFLDSISPLTRLNFQNRKVRPLLLCHGRNDPRVPYSESQAIFKAVNSKSTPVWLLTFEDEGHAFRDLENQIVHTRVMAEFLIQHLDLRPQFGVHP